MASAYPPHPLPRETPTSKPAIWYCQPIPVGRRRSTAPSSPKSISRASVIGSASAAGAAIGAASGAIIGGNTSPRQRQCARVGYDYYGNRVCVAYYE